MLEGFKINCYPLNRTIRVSIHLPMDYNQTRRFYPVIYLFDGQNLYNKQEAYSEEIIDLEKTIEKLKNDGKEAIYVGIAAASNPEKRDLEYSDIELAKFISSSIHPFLKVRYRMNNYIYSCGWGKASLNALALNQEESFKGAVILSPEGMDDDFLKLKLEPNNLYYIYSGEKELNGKCLALANKLKEIIPNSQFVTDDGAIHSESVWQEKIYSALSYLIL